jgi:methyl-accepting chemotaxis protein
MQSIDVFRINPASTTVEYSKLHLNCHRLLIIYFILQKRSTIKFNKDVLRQRNNFKGDTMSVLSVIQKLSIARQLRIIIVSAVLGIIVLTGLFLFSEKAMLLRERESNVRQTVETVEKLVAHYYDLSSKNKMSEADAKQAAKDAVRALRYGTDEYFWINDINNRMVMHPIKPALDGTDLSENKDPTGKRFFAEMVQTVKDHGEGFVFYMWPKPGSETPVGKVSFVKGFTPWGWVIG